MLILFRRLKSEKPLNILLTTGEGEIEEAQTFRLESEMRKFHKERESVIGQPLTFGQHHSVVNGLVCMLPMSLQNQFKNRPFTSWVAVKVIWLANKFDISGQYKHLQNVHCLRIWIWALMSYGLSMALDLCLI